MLPSTITFLKCRQDLAAEKYVVAFCQLKMDNFNKKKIQFCDMYDYNSTMYFLKQNPNYPNS